MSNRNVASPSLSLVHIEPSSYSEGKTQLIALNLGDAATAIGLDYDTARKYGLYEIWEEAGLIWRVPGTNIRRVLFDALRRWVYKNQEEERPGTLADLFKAHEFGRWES